MVVVLRTDKDVVKIKKALANRQFKKFDAKKFCGVLKADEDGLKIQQQLRNEWD